MKHHPKKAVYDGFLNWLYHRDENMRYYWDIDGYKDKEIS